MSFERKPYLVQCVSRLQEVDEEKRHPTMLPQQNSTGSSIYGPFLQAEKNVNIKLRFFNPCSTSASHKHYEILLRYFNLCSIFASHQHNPTISSLIIKLATDSNKYYTQFRLRDFYFINF